MTSHQVWCDELLPTSKDPSKIPLKRQKSSLQLNQLRLFEILTSRATLHLGQSPKQHPFLFSDFITGILATGELYVKTIG